MRRYRIRIKYKSGNVLDRLYAGNATEQFLINFYGLKEPDVDWYIIKSV